MMNHKLTLQLYGVRRPLKWRRRMARLDNRQAARLVANHKHLRGHHSRWWAAALWDEFGDHRSDAELIAEQERDVEEWLDSNDGQLFMSPVVSKTETTEQDGATSSIAKPPEP